MGNDERTPLTGLVLRCVSGFYYVEVGDAVVTCRARGSFRRQGLTPVAGDRVTISRRAEGDGTVESVLPRKNCLVRPPVANVDVLVMVASVREPETNTLVLDKMIAIAEKGKAFHRYYIGSGNPRPLREFLLEMRDIVDPTAEIGLGDLPFRGKDIDYAQFDLKKVERDTGYKNRISFSDGIRMTADYIRKGE